MYRLPFSYVILCFLFAVITHAVQSGKEFAREISSLDTLSPFVMTIAWPRCGRLAATADSGPLSHVYTVTSFRPSGSDSDNLRRRREPIMTPMASACSI